MMMLFRNVEKTLFEYNIGAMLCHRHICYNSNSLFSIYNLSSQFTTRKQRRQMPLFL